MKLTKVLNVTQAVKLFLIASMLVSKGAMMGDTQEKMIINKNRVIINLDASKGQNKSMMFYLKAKRYAPEVQDALINISEHKKDTSDKKE